MKVIRIMVVAISIFGIFLASDSFAQRGMKWKGSSGWGMGSQYNKMYDPKTVETISGEVTNVNRITPLKGMSYGVHTVVVTDKEAISVHLGPGWYIENQDIRIEYKDIVQVTGSRVTFEGQPAIIAAEVRKGNDILTLRDENGFPAWSGWRRR